MGIRTVKQRKALEIYVNSGGLAWTSKAVEEMVPSQAGRLVYLVLLHSELMNLMTLNVPKFFPRLA